MSPANRGRNAQHVVDEEPDALAGVVQAGADHVTGMPGLSVNR
jgi:hypothetical protein